VLSLTYGEPFIARAALIEAVLQSPNSFPKLIHQELVMQPKSTLPESAGNGQSARSKSAASASAGETASRVAHEFQDFVADVEDLIAQTASITAEDLTRVKTKLNERVAVAKETFGDVSDTLLQRARRTATITNNYVREQPWASVGIGAAVGVLLGFALGRRN
jgi:ElaB protein